MKQRGVFLIGLFLVTVYFFLFPRPSGRELILSPDSYLKMDSSPDIQVSPSTPDAELLVVRSGTAAVFLNSKHELVGFFDSPGMAADHSWLAMSGAGGMDILEPGGRLISRIPDKGLPVSRNGNLYSYDEDRLSKINPDNGRIYWTREYVSPVTVLDGRHDRTLVGLLDGRVYLIDDTGATLLSYRPGGSRLEAIYGGVISRDGNKIAIVAGLEPQRFILLEERKNGFRPVSHHDTGTGFRRGIPLGFIRNERQVIYENMNRVTAVNLTNYETTDLPLNGSLAGWADDSVPGILALLGREDRGTNLKLLTRMNLAILESTVPPDTASISGERNSLLIVDDRTVGIMEFSVQ